jgi:hypothetical protein
VNSALNLALKQSQTQHLLILAMLVSVQCLVARPLLPAWTGAFCDSYFAGAHNSIIEMCGYVCVCPMSTYAFSVSHSNFINLFEIINFV